MHTEDKDLPEKIAYKQLLWKLGYYTQINIPVVNFREDSGSLTREDLTDIDVLGIIYDETLNRKIAIGDCKGVITPHNRLLWLKGLQDYLLADTASFIGREINSKFIEVARRLSISLWHPDNISQMLKDHKFDVSQKLFDINYCEEEKELWQHKESNKKILTYKNFIRYTFWELNPRRRLQSIVFNLSEVAKDFEDKHFYYFLAYKTLILTSLSILDMAGFIIKNGRDEIHKHTESFIFGSPSEIDEKKRAFYSIKSNKNKDFYPTYYPQLLDLLNYIIRRSDNSKEIPRYIETIWFNTDFARKNITLKEIAQDNDNTLITLKLSKDISNFLCKATGLDVNFYKILESL